MKVLAINGSPRKGGNTEILLKTVLKQLSELHWETDLVRVGGKHIQGCLACGKCFYNKDKQCINKADEFNAIMEKMIEADAIVMGSPSYFADVTAELKAVIDRAGYVGIANGGLLRGKIGAAVAAARRAGGIHVFDTINHLFLGSGVIVPGSTYWNLGYGHDKGSVENDLEALRNMHDLGNVINWLGQTFKNAKTIFPAPANWAHEDEV